MTISTETSTTEIFEGTGLVSEYDYGFLINAEEDLVVLFRDTDGNETTGTLNVDYTLDGVGETDGGTITLTSSLTLSYKMVAFRSMDYTQETDFTNQGAYYLDTTESMGDNIVMQIQQLNAKAERGVYKEATDDSEIPTFTEISGYATSASASASAAAASAAAALVSENAAAADLVLTNADVVLTHADVVLTNADVVLTNADVVSTAQDVIDSAANASDASDYADAAAASASAASDSEDACSASAILTAADVVSTNADVVSTAASAAAAAASAAVAFVNVKAHVQCITSTNKSLTGTWTEDGYAIQAGDRVAVNGQTNAAENGIYVAAAGAWSRSADFDEPDETILVNFYVRYGDVYAQTRWLQTGDVATIGVDDINFVLVATSGAAVEVQYAEATHGFSVGQPVRYDGTNWVTAQADSEANAEMDGLVTDTLDGDNFKLAPVGEVDIADWSNAESSGSATLTVGQIYFLDPDTTGQIVDEDYLSLADGEVSKPIGKAVSTTKMMVYNYRGNVIGGGTAHSSSFVAGDITSNILTVVHGQNTLRPKIMFFNADNEPVIPASWSPTDDTNVNSSDITVSDEVIAQIGADTWRVEVDSTGVARTDNLSDSDPEPVGATASAGTSEDHSRADHVHRAKTGSIIQVLNIYGTTRNNQSVVSSAAWTVANYDTGSGAISMTATLTGCKAGNTLLISLSLPLKTLVTSVLCESGVTVTNTDEGTSEQPIASSGGTEKTSGYGTIHNTITADGNCVVVAKFRASAATTTIFCDDASGSKNLTIMEVQA